MIIIKYSDPEYKNKKEELEKLGWKVRVWVNDGLGYFPKYDEKDISIKNKKGEN